jgi:YfiH family protein
MMRDGRLLGYELRLKDKFYFFGSRHLGKDDLPTVFPQYEFAFVQQIHGREIVAADPNHRREADGLYTDRPGLACVVQTGDCVPILMAGTSNVCALHAGWRGVARNIVQAARPLWPAGAHLQAAIGPHIGLQSFEVGTDVAADITAACPLPAKEVSSSGEGNKLRLDLGKIVRAQLQESYGDETDILLCQFDTKTVLDFHSHRRDRERAGRQYSFIVINS